MGEFGEGDPCGHVNSLCGLTHTLQRYLDTAVGLSAPYESLGVHRAR
jgi:hypothetical protein